MRANLTPEKALIFRITHRTNVPWIMQNGLHCANSGERDPRFVQIGNPDLIGRRSEKAVGGPFGGTLSDYVPFYFTPYSPMLLNIVTGRGVPKQPKRDIVVFASSIWKFEELDVRYVISDRHAYLDAAQFIDSSAGLQWLDWVSLQARDFKRDPNDPAKFERYEAETLALSHVPANALLGAYAYDAEAAAEIESAAQGSGVNMKVIVQPQVFF